MMDLINVVKDVVVEYYPIVLGFVGIAGVAIGSAYVIYTQMKTTIQPVLDWLNRNKEEDDEKATVASVLESINIETAKADLLYKIENESVSPALTLVYQTQLDRLMAITSTVTDTTASIVDKADDYL